MGKILLATMSMAILSGAYASSDVLIESDIHQDGKITLSQCDEYGFLSKSLKDFPQAIAITRALLSSEAAYYGDEMERCNAFEQLIYCQGFKATAEGLLRNINEITSERFSTDIQMAKKILRAFERSEKINAKAKAVFDLLSPDDTQARETLNSFIVQKLISPFLKESASQAPSVSPALASCEKKTDDWLPDHIKKFQKRNQVVKGKTKKKKCIQRNGRPQVKAPLPVAEPSCTDTESVKVDVASVLPVVQMETPVETNLVEEKEIKSEVVSVPLSKECRVTSAVKVPVLKEAPKAGPKKTQVDAFEKIEVSKDSWDTMVRLRKLKKEPLNSGELAQKILMSDLFNLIKDVGGVVAPGGKTNINLAVPSLMDPKGNTWESVAIHRLHGDRARFLPVDTLSWGNRIKRLLEDAHIGPETIVSKS